MEGIIVCPACSNVLPPERKFCTRCGLDLTSHKKSLEARREAEAAKRAAAGLPPLEPPPDLVPQQKDSHSSVPTPWQPPAAQQSSAPGPAASALPPPPPQPPRSVPASPFYNPTLPEDYTPPFSDAFAYPFRGSGLMVILVGASMLTIAKIMPLFLFVALIAAGYAQLYYFEVINTSSSDKANPPDFPSAGLWELISAFFMMLLINLFSFLPLAIYWVVSLTDKTTSNPLIYMACMLWTAIYYPMALILVAETRNGISTLPCVVLMAIVHAPPRYYLMSLCLLILAIPFIAGSMLGGVGKAGFLIVIAIVFFISCLTLYSNIVLCRILGVFFRDLVK